MNGIPYTCILRKYSLLGKAKFAIYICLVTVKVLMY